MPLEIKNRQTVLLIGAGACLLLLVLNSFVYEPLVASWKDRSARIEALQKDIRDGEAKAKRAAYYAGKWESMRTNALPGTTSAAEAQLQRAFARWERAAGVTRLSFKPQWKTEDDYMTLECRADYSGNLSALTEFLYELENDPLGVKVDNVEIAAQNDNGRQLSLGLQVSGLLLTPTPAAQQP